MQRLRAEARGEQSFTRGAAPQEPKGDDAEISTDAAVTPAVEAKGEPAKDIPAPVEFSDDPTSWPEPARAALESTKAELAGFQEQIGQYETLVPRAIEQNQRLAEELKLWRALGEANGMSLDQRDVDLVGYRVKETNATKLAQMAEQRQTAEAQRAQQQQQQAAQLQAQSKASAWLSDVQAQAKKAGVEMADVATILHSQVAAKREPDVAGAIEWAKAKALAKQREVNAKAPTSIATTVPSGTTLPRDRTTEGRLNRLRQLGHAV